MEEVHGGMQAYGGVSVVNAVGSWFGSSMAVDLKVEVTVREGRPNIEDPLIKEILEFFHRRYGVPDLEVEVRSEIPSGSGLKSSSAVSTALIGEISRTYGVQVDVPKLSAILSLKAGVSYTGALDDAVAAYFGGISFTHNKEFKVIRRDRAPEDVKVILLARGGRGGVDPNRLKGFPLLFRSIFELAIQGRLWEAMRLNGIAVAEILGYSKEPVDDALRRGALASGISGNGPSYFAVVKCGEEGPILDSWTKFGKITVVRPINLEG
jgi:shikimate kinase (EC 2.7.1.71)